MNRACLRRGTNKDQRIKKSGSFSKCRTPAKGGDTPQGRERDRRAAQERSCAKRAGSQNRGQ